MKSIWILILALSIFTAFECLAQVVPAVPAPSPIAAVIVPATPPPPPPQTVVVSPKAQTPVVVDVIKANPAPVVPEAPMALNTGSAIQPVVIQDVDQAPPQWMQSALVMVKSLPVVGPIVSKAIQWLAVITSILTALCGCILLILRALSGIASVSQLTVLSEAVVKFQNGPIMYYLKYASLFNAKKPEGAAVASVPAQPVAAV